MIIKAGTYQFDETIIGSPIIDDTGGECLEQEIPFSGREHIETVHPLKDWRSRI